jgi:tRNA pseudouridine65 synthase
MRPWLSPAGSFEILDSSPELWVVSKPAGWLTHRTRIAPREFGIVEVLSKQLSGSYTDESLRPIHRLDRATSGVLLIARTQDAATLWGARLREKTVKKTYIAVVRGWCDDTGVIERELERSPGQNPAPACTRYQTLGRVEVPHALSSRYPTSRYSIVKVVPETGKNHQIRKHFEGIRHPLIGDTIYGEGRHNRFFRSQYEFGHLALHARTLEWEDHLWQAQIPTSWGRFLTPWIAQLGLSPSWEENSGTENLTNRPILR